MAIVTGTLADFGRANLITLNPELLFYPEDTTTSGSMLLMADKPVSAVIDNAGNWTANLEPTENMSPRRYYKLRIRCRDTSGEFVYADFPDWKLYVPSGGGEITSLLDTPLDTGWVWVIDGGTDPAAARSGDLLFDSSTDNLYRL
jgi:hypothetical protein